MDRLALLFIGGGLGALLRHLTTLTAVRLFGTGFPWGTLAVNWVGCFIIGILFALGEKAEWLGHSTRMFWMTGFLGGLTTFSTYGLETVHAVGNGWGSALSNVMANNIGGLLLVAAGMWIVKVIN